MAGLILAIIVIAASIGISAAIGFICLELVVRLIGRGLGVEFAPARTVRRSGNRDDLAVI
jgi:hypothetical protein